ncbi:MAG: hypothetical protein ACE5KZ_13225 [Candidatus Scalinduaceae bacterium]
MIHRFINIYFSRTFIIIFATGVLLLFLSLLFETALSQLWRTFLHVIGIAFIAVALTAPISEFFQFQTLSKYMGILRGAQDSGIIHIYQSRLEDRESFQKTVESEFAQSNKVLLVGVGFPRIFHNPPLPKPIGEKMFNPNIPIKILLLDPKGDAAQERTNIETGRKTRNDIISSIESFRLILRERARIVGIDIDSKNVGSDVIEKIKMEVHLYDFVPVVFMIMTQRSLLLEQYNFGRLPDAMPGDCIGGRIPVIQFGAHALTYKIMEQHFSYIWENKSTDITMQLLVNTENSC